MTYGIGNPGPVLGLAQKSGSVKPVNEIPTLLDNWILNSNIDINNNKNPAKIYFHSKIPHTITKINDNINMNSTIAGSVNAYS